MIYLDSNATSIIDRDVLQYYIELLQDRMIGNPHSNEHLWGWNGQKIVEDAAERIAEQYGFFGSDLIFTSGATEANNLAILGVAQGAIEFGDQRRKILVSAIEHKCVLNSAAFAAKQLGFTMEVIPVESSGMVDLKALKTMLNEDVLLVSVMAVNNEIGTIQPLEEVAALTKKVGAIFHSDMAQAGYCDIDAFSLGIDLLSLSAHKIYGPKGVGALLVDRANLPVPLAPILHGGGQQEGLRAGTLSPALCGAFAYAVEKMAQNREEEGQRFREWREFFLHKLREAGIDFVVNGTLEKRHPGNLNLSILGVDSRLLIARVANSVAISSGSACNSGIIERSYVLRALGLKDERIESAFRLCFGRHNVVADIEVAANLIITMSKGLLSLNI